MKATGKTIGGGDTWSVMEHGKTGGLVRFVGSMPGSISSYK